MPKKSPGFRRFVGGDCLDLRIQYQFENLSLGITRDSVHRRIGWGSGGGNLLEDERDWFEENIEMLQGKRLGCNDEVLWGDEEKAGFGLYVIGNGTVLDWRQEF